MKKFIRTDDMQLLRKVKDGVFELCEFSNSGDDYLFSYDKIIIANWKDSDSEWDSDAISIIKSYYKSLDDLRKSVSSKEEEEQIVAEMLFEQTSQLGHDMPVMTEAEAEKYLDDIINGKVVLEF